MTSEWGSQDRVLGSGLWIQSCSLDRQKYGPCRLSHMLTRISPALEQLWATRFHSLVPWDGWKKKGLTHEDWRYSDFRGKIRNDAAYWAFSFSSFHLTPALLVFGASIPLARLLAAPSASLPALSIAQVPKLSCPPSQKCDQIENMIRKEGRHISK